MATPTLPYSSEIDAEARRLFNQETTAIAGRDRGDYRSFEQMPLGLQQWWKYRAERRLIVNANASVRMRALRRK
jgi:hypothetical protein